MKVEKIKIWHISDTEVALLHLEVLAVNLAICTASFVQPDQMTRQVLINVPIISAGCNILVTSKHISRSTGIFIRKFTHAHYSKMSDPKG